MIKAGQLTDTEIVSLKAYASSMYKLINAALRGDEEFQPSLFDHIASIDSALSKSALSKDIIVYRGLNGDAAAYLRRMGLAIGDEFSEASYASTSLDRKQAERFAAWPRGGIVLKIHVRSGKQLIDMSLFSDYPDECEILLPRDSIFQILAGENSNHVVEVEVVNDPRQSL